MIPDVLRPSPKYPTYPPYHEGLYLEDYFYEWSKGKSFNRTYLPIFWTTLYCDQHQINIQNILNRLDPNGKYFTVCQHDDAPRERLPKDTIIFSSGGHFYDKPLIPLPSICSKIKNPNLSKKRDIFCSFVGSSTHEIRNKMCSLLKDNPEYSLNIDSWKASVPAERFELFKDITERSEFCLCPRGYGRSSCRLYESMQLGSIPVYISDSHYLPWSDELNWDNYCIIVKDTEIDNIDEILRSVSQERKNTIRHNIKKHYDAYFSLTGVCENIEKRVNI